MRWVTKITKMLGCKYPLIQGAFSFFGTADLAAPVSDAGGFGIITAHNFTPEGLRDEIIRAKSMTNNPFGVNFTVMPRTSADFVETPRDYKKYIDVVIDEGIKTCFTSAYKAKEIGERLKDNEINWIHKCAIMKHALKAEKDGADAVVIVGLEGTGYKNPIQNTTMINMVMANRLLRIPFIAAGGIGDARGFLGSLAMGAEAVYMGTAFMATKECPIPENFKRDMIVKQDCFDPKMYERLYHHKLKDSGTPSMAVGVIDDILTAKEFIEKIMKDAEGMLRRLGFNSDCFDTTNI
ncbi:NAD(P)H-dependent flavin oxidoreductase [Candidatus Methanoliparum sp. LAM-1]|nr:nitronate monooxygenase [Candidatus Methanoliparum sp. LAM-1]BDC36106.1 2-nitropropane dioxygenase [Candidatus Methanoliparum sp. LAM-1]